MLFTHAFRSITHSCLSLTEPITLGLSATFAQAQQEATEDWVNATMCAVNDRAVDLSKAPSFTYTGADGNNPRYLSAAQSGLVTEDFANLELAWAVAFPATSSMRAAPVIVGSTVFYSATDSGRVFALDTASGCAKWVYEPGTRLRSSLAYDVVDDEGVLVLSLIHI